MKSQVGVNKLEVDKENSRWCIVGFEVPMKFKSIDITNPLRKVNIQAAEQKGHRIVGIAVAADFLRVRTLLPQERRRVGRENSLKDD
jgi:hypothetical protein